MKGASKEADVTCANDKRGHHYSAVSRRRACLRISVRVDWIGISITWNFLLACQALNCRVQRVRRETMCWVRQKSPSHTTTMRDYSGLFHLHTIFSEFSGCDFVPFWDDSRRSNHEYCGHTSKVPPPRISQPRADHDLRDSSD